MNIFIGSSREASEVLDWIAECLERHGHEPLRWDNPGLFPPGEGTFQRLVEISKTVNGAIFIFSEDDRVWYRGDGAHQPRDNVLIEYGLFAGRLGAGKAIMAVYKAPRQASDLLGLTYVDVSETRRERARVELRIWASNLQSEKVDPVTLQLMAKLSEQDKKVQSLEQQLSFETEKSQEFELLLSRKGVLDLTEIDLASDGYWKLLFEFGFFWPLSSEIAKHLLTQLDVQAALLNCGANAIENAIAWDNNHTRRVFLIRKALRLFRGNFMKEAFRDFICSSEAPLKEGIDRIAQDAITKRQLGSTVP